MADKTLEIQTTLSQLVSMAKEQWGETVDRVTVKHKFPANSHTVPREAWHCTECGCHISKSLDSKICKTLVPFKPGWDLMLIELIKEHKKRNKHGKQEA